MTSISSPIPPPCVVKNIAANQTAQPLQESAAAAGDYLLSILIVPETVSPGVVMLRDGTAGTDIVLFEGGADSVGTLHSWEVLFDANALAAGGWRVTTGADVHVVAKGRFS